MIKYCSRCVLPSSKPDLYFDSAGVCSACKFFLERPSIDWAARKSALFNILDSYRRIDGYWDCVIPVSGGKDSTFQVIRMLEFGMNPLCVTATTCDESDLGRKNIENLKELGVDHIQFSPKPNVRRILNRLGLMEVGDISWPEHLSIFTIPFRIASSFGVSLVVYGENPQNEYGGPDSAAKATLIDRRWLEEFGGLLGLRVSDLADSYGILNQDLAAYKYPTSEELNKAQVKGIFLGQFLPWDGFDNFTISSERGFTSYSKSVEGSYGNYENLDNYQVGIHDYFKFLKFGFGRASDIVSMHIRRGRLSRTDGIEIVKEHDGQFPWSYLGKSLESILSPLGISISDFIEICDRFTNKEIFECDSNGTLKKDKNLNLFKRYELTE